MKGLSSGLSTGTQNASNPATDQLELISMTSERSSSMHVTVHGEVKNISSENMKSVEAVVSWYDKTHHLITSETALIQYNPVLANQTSPFEVITTWNPAMDNFSIEFKQLFGGTINFKDSRHK